MTLNEAFEKQVTSKEVMQEMPVDWHNRIRLYRYYLKQEMAISDATKRKFLLACGWQESPAKWEKVFKIL